jgi:hypothetical protein
LAGLLRLLKDLAGHFEKLAPRNSRMLGRSFRYFLVLREQGARNFMYPVRYF